MPKPIISDKCSNCNTCIEICPVDVFSKGEKKVQVKKPEACIGCRACEVQCPEECIKIED